MPPFGQSCFAFCRVRTRDRVQLRGLEARELRGEDLVGPLAAELPARAQEGRAVDRVVHGLAGLDVAQRGPRGVEGEVARAHQRVDEVALLVDAELLRERAVLRRGNATEVVVDLAGLHLQQALVLIRVRRDDDPVRVGGPVALVLRVALEHDLTADVAADDLVRAGRRVDVNTLGVDRHVRLDRREERHRDLRDERRVGVDQVDGQLLTGSLDARDAARLAVVEGLAAGDVRRERDRRGALIRIADAEDGPCEGGSRARPSRR